MSILTGDGATTATAEVTEERAARRGILFWVRRYLPAEILGTVVMLLAGVAVSGWLAAPAAVAVAAVIGESLGFYGVLAVTVYVEQIRVTDSRRAVVRTGLLLVAEFGAAELLDTLLVRPAALFLGVLLIPDPVWGLMAGKVAADVVFYAVAAGAFTVTAKAGLRGERSKESS